MQLRWLESEYGSRVLQWYDSTQITINGGTKYEQILDPNGWIDIPTKKVAPEKKLISIEDLAKAWDNVCSPWAHEQPSKMKPFEDFCKELGF